MGLLDMGIRYCLQSNDIINYLQIMEKSKEKFKNNE